MTVVIYDESGDWIAEFDNIEDATVYMDSQLLHSSDNQLEPSVEHATGAAQ